MGARREAQNLLTPSAGRKTMAVSEPRAKWAAGLLETATPVSYTPSDAADDWLVV